MAKIFISYAKEDLDRARQIYNLLVKEGHNIWFDEESLVGGSNWKIEITRAIKKSDFFIACFSTRSINKRGYFQKELRESIEVCNEFPPGEIFVIPVKFESCPLPEQFSDLHFVEWEAPNGPNKLLRAISSNSKYGMSEKVKLNLVKAIANIKSQTKILYPELLKSVTDYKTSTEPCKILNSTIRRIHDDLELLKSDKLLHYHVTIPDFTVEIVNSIKLSEINIRKVQPLIIEVEKNFQN